MQIVALQELLHAVLADDVEAVKMIKSKNQKDITVNIRHRVREWLVFGVFLCVIFN